LIVVLPVISMVYYVSLCWQVFSMDTPELSVMYYASSRMPVHAAVLERCAEQIATLCATLSEYPLIRYQLVSVTLLYHVQ